MNHAARKRNTQNSSQGRIRGAAESGNALVYVLIAIGLFAALSFTLTRQTDTSEGGSITEEQVELTTTQLISYATQARSALDQMDFSSVRPSEMIFILPSDANFETETPPAIRNIYKVYHPDGGGLIPGTLPEKAIAQVNTTPPPGWYMGRFNNVDWTPLGPGNTAGTAGAEAPYEEVILIAYQISQAVCEKINEKVIGTNTIPTISVPLKQVFIDDATTGYGAGTNTHLTTGTGNICVECENVSSLCVQQGGIYGFYNILADQ